MGGGLALSLSGCTHACFAGPACAHQGRPRSPPLISLPPGIQGVYRGSLQRHQPSWDGPALPSAGRCLLPGLPHHRQVRNAVPQHNADRLGFLGRPLGTTAAAAAAARRRRRSSASLDCSQASLALFSPASAAWCSAPLRRAPVSRLPLLLLRRRGRFRAAWPHASAPAAWRPPLRAGTATLTCRRPAS